MPILKLKGEQFEVKRSDKPDKKLMAKCDGKWVHFGAKGMGSWYKAPFASLLPENEKHNDPERRRRYLARAGNAKRKDGSLQISHKCSPAWFSYHSLW